MAFQRCLRGLNLRGARLQLLKLLGKSLLRAVDPASDLAGGSAVDLRQLVAGHRQVYRHLKQHLIVDRQLPKRKDSELVLALALELLGGRRPECARNRVLQRTIAVALLSLAAVVLDHFVPSDAKQKSLHAVALANRVGTTDEGLVYGLGHVIEGVGPDLAQQEKAELTVVSPHQHAAAFGVARVPSLEKLAVAWFGRAQKYPLKCRPAEPTPKLGRTDTLCFG